MEKIDVVIIDNEEANVELLEHFLIKYCPLANIVGSAYSKKEAISLIDTIKPKLIFLDIVMEDGTGFDVIEKIEHNKAKVIFVTSYDKYAIKAFKYSAVDYLLKPVKTEELIVAFNNAYEDLTMELFTNNEYLNEVSNLIINKQPLEFIAVPSLQKIELIKLKEIVFLKSEGRYTEFYLSNGKKIVSSRNLGKYENIIDEHHFFRIHNSYIVNLNHVLNIYRADGAYCEMTNKIMLPVAKRRQDQLHRFLKVK